jgi:hypothetical protein
MSFLTVFAIGAAIGAGAAILATPRSGRDLRETIMARLGGWTESDTTRYAPTYSGTFVPQPAPTTPIVPSGAVRPDLAGPTSQRRPEPVSAEVATPRSEPRSEPPVETRMPPVGEAASPADSVQTSTDAEIMQAVQTRLADDSRTEDAAIEVISSNGQVTLTGTAPSHEARAAAEEIASGVHGVTIVVNDLVVPIDGDGGGTPRPPGTFPVPTNEAGQSSL